MAQLTRRDKSFCYFPLNLGGSLKPLFRLLPLPLFSLWDILGMVKISCLQHVVARQGNMIDPVPMGCHVVEQRTLHCIPDADRFVMASGVNMASPPPSYTTDGPLVTAQDVFSPAGIDNPDTARAVFARARDPGGTVSPHCIGSG